MYTRMHAHTCTHTFNTHIFTRIQLPTTHHIPNVQVYLIKTLRNEDNVLVELTGCDISRHNCTLNIPIHYSLDTDGVVAISKQGL